jgi:hypothetical protein
MSALLIWLSLGLACFRLACLVACLDLAGARRDRRDHQDKGHSLVKNSLAGSGVPLLMRKNCPTNSAEQK